jgi:hypothetical protein
MKVIGVDNFARESVPDILVQDEMNPEAAASLASRMNEEGGDKANRWYIAVEDNYRLSRGMEDLV